MEWLIQNQICERLPLSFFPSSPLYGCTASQVCVKVQQEAWDFDGDGRNDTAAPTVAGLGVQIASDTLKGFSFNPTNDKIFPYSTPTCSLDGSGGNEGWHGCTVCWDVHEAVPTVRCAQCWVKPCADCQPY